MSTSKKIRGLSRALVVLAAASAYGSALAQEGGGLAPLATSESSVSVGLGVASGDSSDRARFGLYNGLRKDDANLLFGFNYRNRDESSGKWLTINGRNIGLDNREFGASYRWLGDMKFNVDYSEIVRHDPRTINTSLSGAGTTTPTVSLLATPGTGQDLNLELKRKGLGFNFEKMFGNYQVEVSFKNEEKEGARFFGKGFACSTAWANVGACTLGVGGTAASRALTDGASAVLMLPEPVNSVHRQFEAKLNYSGQNLRLSGGYYGSFYTNRNGNMTPTIVGPFSDQNGGANPANAGLATTMGLPMALAPDNQAHQLSLAGNYTITPKTRINFKYAYTHATQNESFGGMGLSGEIGRAHV